jgi:hypothetical protein
MERHHRTVRDFTGLNEKLKMPTLAELKAENAAEEKAAAQTPEPEDNQDDYSPEPEDAPEKIEAKSEPESTGEEEPADEVVVATDDAFIPEEDDGLPKDGPLRKGDAKALREKYQGKLSKEREEKEELRLKLEELERKIAAPAQSLPANIGQEPQREQYNNDAEWIRALTTYNAQVIHGQTAAQIQADEQKRKREELASKTRVQTDAHYGRVAELAKKSNISADVAQSADLKVRNAVDAVFKGAGDTIVDTLISSLGAGSEKVILHLGLKTSKLNELVRLFQDDPSGIKASAYLGTLKAELNAPTRKETKAPDPIDKIQGDKNSGLGMSGELRKKVADARRKGDISGVIKLKQEAKALKLDTSKW